MPVIRKIVLILIVAIAPISGTAIAQNYDSLFEEFDARPLRYDEKRFLQGTLALQGFYTALLDGAWGRGSQNAIERYTIEKFEDIPRSVHMATLVFDFVEDDQESGWQTKYLPDLGISLILPETKTNLVDRRDRYYYWESTNSLKIMATAHSQTEMIALHQRMRALFVSSRSPYILQNPTRWVSGSAINGGGVVYLRSDLVNGLWSTVLISVAQSDANILNFISTSLEVGRSRNFEFPLGGLVQENLNLLVSYFDSRDSTADVSVAEVAPESESTIRGDSSGTGFYVNAEGLLLTNAHVAENCELLTVGGQTYSVVAISNEFDLALLSPDAQNSVNTFASFSARPARLNADVTVAGFPLPQMLSGLNVTRGAVTALSGLGGDPIQMQISAPVQPGNSGGPVLDKAGNVIGVVVSKLDGLLVAEAIGDIPQNVNFAIRGEIAKLFLGSIGYDYSIALSSERREPTEIAELASAFTALILCQSNRPEN